MSDRSTGLGRGLGALIPQKSTEEMSRELGERVLEIPINKIIPNSRQPREQFGEAGIEDLKQSILTHGILQPLVVIKKDDGYELVAGERRLRAAKGIGLARVPAVVRTATEQQKLELSLIENLQRENLNAIEEAKAYRALIDEFGLRHDEVAARVGKSRPVVSNTLRLLDLPEEIQQALIAGRIAYSAARALLGVSPEERKRTFDRLMRGEKISSGEIEKQLPPQRRKEDPNLRAAEARLRESLGTKVVVNRRGSRGTIVIEFYSDEELAALLDHFH